METQLTRTRGLGAAARARIRLTRIMVVICVAVGVCAYFDRETRTFDMLEQKTYGDRLEVAARIDDPRQQRARAQIVLVTLTDSSFSNARHGLTPEPFLPRIEHAALVRRLTACGANVIGFDFLFDTPQAGDDALTRAVRSSKNVLLACGDDSGDPPRLLLPEACLLRAGAHQGHTRCPVDPDRPALDRVQPVISERGLQVPAFCLEAVRMALGCCRQPLARTASGWRCAALNVPVGEDGTFALRYVSSSRAHFAEIPYEDVLTSTPAQTAFYRAIFQDKIVLIGDTTRIHGDVHLTPLGMMSGVEIQAHAIATLLAGRFLRDAPWWENVAAMLVLASLAAVATVLWRLPLAALALALLLPTYFVFDVWLFVERDTALHLVAPEATLVLAAMGILLERGLSEGQEKTWMRAILHRYFSPQIVNYLLKHPESIGEAGRQMTGTILFSDIRGFTALSENLPPEDLVSRMNEYFEAMTSVIFKHDGTVVSIAGDGILSVFGVPVAMTDHARCAVTAAIEMQEELKQLQEQWRAEGRAVFDMGIGINTGEMIVGDVGGSRLMNFTVYGLQVNIAARVEDLNKELGSRILITQATFESAQKEITVCGPTRRSLKGLEIAVDVYEVLGGL